MTPAGKACTGCGETLPLSDFYPSKNGRYGRESKCRACKVEYKRAWRRRNPGRDNYYTPKHSNIEPPPGLHAPTAWAARLTGAPADAFRNHACPHYDECLGAAASHKPELDFSCRGCRHEADRQAVELDHGDLAGCIGFYWSSWGARTFRTSEACWTPYRGAWVK